MTSDELQAACKRKIEAAWKALLAAIRKRGHKAKRQHSFHGGLLVDNAQLSFEIRPYHPSGILGGGYYSAEKIRASFGTNRPLHAVSFVEGNNGLSIDKIAEAAIIRAKAKAEHDANVNRQEAIINNNRRTRDRIIKSLGGMPEGADVEVGLVLDLKIRGLTPTQAADIALSTPAKCECMIRFRDMDGRTLARALQRAKDLVGLEGRSET